jgi:hypothetical protein
MSYQQRGLLYPITSSHGVSELGNLYSDDSPSKRHKSEIHNRAKRTSVDVLLFLQKGEHLLTF